MSLEPKAPSMVDTVGFEGKGMGKTYREILKGQMAVSEPGKDPNFAGKVKSFIRVRSGAVGRSPRAGAATTTTETPDFTPWSATRSAAP